MSAGYKDKIGSLWLVGGNGKMGSALNAIWQEDSVVDSVQVIGRETPDQTLVDATPPETIFLTVKPQVAKEDNFAVVRRYKPYLNKNTILVSSMAGLPTDLLRSQGELDADVPIVRAMPNTPCQIGEGITGLYAGPEVTPPHRRLASGLFEKAGEVFWVTDEDQMHAVTALTGSGPGFTFAMMEEMEKEGAGRDTVIGVMLDAADNAFNDEAEPAGTAEAFAFVRNFKEAAIEQGFNPQLAERMAVRTVRGSALLARATGKPFAELRQNVTSKGGTTASGLEQFQENGAFLDAQVMSGKVGAAVNAATSRSRELAMPVLVS